MATQIASVTTGADSVTWSFADGTERTVQLGDLSENVINQLALHGLKQKGTDAYSGFGTKYGDEAVSHAAAANGRVIEALKNGDFNAARQAGTSGPKVTIWVEALAQAKGCSVAEAADIYAGLDKEQKAQVRKHSKVKAAKVQLEAERMGAASDEDDGDLPV